MKLEFSVEIFEKFSSVNFHENPSIGSQVVWCERRDRHDEANSRFSKFMNAPNSRCTHSQCSVWIRCHRQKKHRSTKKKIPKLTSTKLEKVHVYYYYYYYYYYCVTSICDIANNKLKVVHREVMLTFLVSYVSQCYRDSEINAKYYSRY